MRCALSRAVPATRAAKQSWNPRFGQVKMRQNAGQLRLRGLAGAQGEWLVHTICDNLRKLRSATDAGLAPS